MEKLKGHFVRSLSGQDKGQILLVISVYDEKMLLLADGKVRKLETAKRKKRKHVMPLDVAPLPEEEVGMLTNKKLHRAIMQVERFFETQKE